MIEVKTRGLFPSTLPETYYLETATKRAYRRIYAGLAWPGINPGFLVVAGEELDEDKAIGAHKCHILSEYENADLPKLIQRCRESKSLMHVSNIYGDRENRPMVEVVNHSPYAFYLESAPFSDDPKAIPFYLSVIREMTGATRKRLYFGNNSRLPGLLAAVDDSLLLSGKDQFILKFPAVVALGYVLAAFKIHGYFDPNIYRVPEPDPEPTF